MYLFSQVVEKAKPKRDQVAAQETVTNMLNKTSTLTPEKGDKPSKKKSPDKPHK